MHRTFAEHFTVEGIYIGTLVTLLDALERGITTVVDNMHLTRSLEFTEASVSALRDSGLRGVHGYGRARTGSWDPAFLSNASVVRDRYFPSDDQLTTMRLYLLGRDDPQEIDDFVRVRRELDLWLTFDSGLHATMGVESYYADGRFHGREAFNHGHETTLNQRLAVRDGGGQVNVSSDRMAVQVGQHSLSRLG